jgi:hypothetical protein
VIDNCIDYSFNLMLFAMYAWIVALDLQPWLANEYLNIFRN